MTELVKQQFPKLSEAQQVWIYIYTAQGSSGILENLGNDNAGLTQL